MSSLNQILYEIAFGVSILRLNVLSILPFCKKVTRFPLTIFFCEGRLAMYWQMSGRNAASSKLPIIVKVHAAALAVRSFAISKIRS